MTDDMTKHLYNDLRWVLNDSFMQAAYSKGQDRHNPTNLPFDQQPILTITRMVGMGFPLGQAVKKTQEASTMLARGKDGDAIRELRGAIVYLAAAILRIEESQP